MDSRRPGYTLAEMLTVIVILGILANIALPLLHRARTEADATRIIADFGSIRHAALHHIANGAEYPPTAGWGVVPPDLVDDLPTGFGFGYGDADYRWRHWSVGPGLGGRVTGRGLVAIEIRSESAAILQEVRNRFGGTSFGSGNRLTLIIE
jgi:prepilin-type N-terminal cleavage/methylation domain-containing protein